MGCEGRAAALVAAVMAGRLFYNVTMVKKVVKTISASELKANCKRVLDEVEFDDVQFIVTKRGVPLVKIRRPRNFVPRERTAK